MYDGLIKKISNKINLIVMPYLSKDYFFNIEEYDEILIFRLYNKKDEIYSIICDEIKCKCCFIESSHENCIYTTGDLN